MFQSPILADSECCPIYLTADLTLWVMVDRQDYGWASQWLWNPKHRPSLRGDHYYAKRNIGSARTPVYLHVEIMTRAEPMPRRRRIVDHINGNTLDCRRKNLRWVTPKKNANNLGGTSFLLTSPLFVSEVPF